MEEAAVAVVEEVGDGLAHAVGHGEVDVGGGGAGGGVAVEHDEGRPSRPRASRASAAMEEAMTPSRAARAEAKGSRAGPVPSGEG